MQKVAFIAIVLVFISGCSVLRREGKTTPEKEHTSEVSLKSIIEKNLTRGNFNIQKAEIQYIDEKSTVNLIASLKYQTGEEYLISLRSKSGIEIARMLITKDTILVNDRVNKKLYYGSSDYLQEKYGISTEAIPLLFGDLIVDDNKEVIIECKDGKSEINVSINSKKIKYSIDCDEKKVTGIDIEGDEDESLIEIKLDNFQYIENYVFPGIIELREVNGRSKIDIYIKKIEFKIENGIKFIPGANYEMVQIR